MSRMTPGVDELAILLLHEGNDRGNDRRNDEHDDHDVLELFEELDREALFLGFFKRVFAEFRRSLLRLCGGKSSFGRVQSAQHLIRRLIVIDDGGDGVGGRFRLFFRVF